ncbi:MAG TPA: PD-(D/E)XK nuclease family protein [Candidatus Aquicultor sp.]|jgi:hypothetical protein
MDPHKNIFYYYRGPRHKSSSEEYTAADRVQIEDNTTKALINVLEGASEAVLRQFLNYLGITRLSSGGTHFALQRSHVPDLGAQHKVILALAPTADIEEGNASNGRGRPDAWLYSPSFVVLIENKTFSRLNCAQLQRHAASIGATEQDIRVMMWAELYLLFSSIKPENNTDWFLLRHFIDYLELIGLAPFTGFTSDDFDFFIMRDEDYKRIIKGKLSAFAEELCARLPAEITKAYPDQHVGRLIPGDDRDAWVALRKPQENTDIFKQCNFNAVLGKDGLRLSAVIRNGRHTDKNKAIGRFYSGIKANRGEFTSLLKMLAPDYELRIYERTSASGEYPRQGDEYWHLKSILSLDVAIDAVIDYLIIALEEIDFPGINVGKSISRGNPILADKEQLLTISAQAIQDLNKVLKFLEIA